jgi:hypothetical protein
MGKQTKTYKTERLYHQLLSPKNIPADQLPFLISKLYEAGFIEVFTVLEDERYLETEKLLSGEHKNELFKIIGGLK